MSGHSKWSTIKHKKGIADSRRGQLFTKLLHNIEVAARIHGGDINANALLYDAVRRASKNSIPKSNIERAIKRGSGDDGTDGKKWEEIKYEGYCSSGAAFIIDVLTDNKNRAASDIKSMFKRCNGRIGEPGSASYLFNYVAIIIFDDEYNEDILMDILLKYDEDNLPNKLEGNISELYVNPKNLLNILNDFKLKNINYKDGYSHFVPHNGIEFDTLKDQNNTVKLYEELQNINDVVNIQTNIINLEQYI